MSSLLSNRRQATRERIINSALELLADADPASVSMPVVAETSEVSLRTLYRYFPTKSDLLDAAGAWFSAQTWTEAVDVDDVDQLGPGDFRAFQRLRFADFAENLSGVLVQHSTPAGRELRRHRLTEQRSQVSRALDNFGIELAGAERARLVDAMLVVASSATFLELVDRMGYRSDEAADLSTWILEALLAHAMRTGSTTPSEGTP